jgi:hypothetical protein
VHIKDVSFNTKSFCCLSQKEYDYIEKKIKGQEFILVVLVVELFPVPTNYLSLCCFQEMGTELCCF